ncbi:MAG: hypothetical protein ACJAVI_001264 [Candidatus Azotimanducaceae bacterium]|jgi:hypothetical protein
MIRSQQPFGATGFFVSVHLVSVKTYARTDMSELICQDKKANQRNQQDKWVKE